MKKEGINESPAERGLWCCQWIVALPVRATVVLYYAVDWPEAPMTISTATAIYNASVNAKVKKRIATCGILMCEYINTLQSM